jgi:hypothetical protein
MCAEAVPWRCHRSLIADALLVRGIRTEDIMSPTRRQVHTLTPFAKVQGIKITYPAENLKLPIMKASLKCDRSPLKAKRLTWMTANKMSKNAKIKIIQNRRKLAGDY